MDGVEVSVAVLTYNSDKYKTIETIKSILMQEKVTIEIIISDDGSRDNNFDFIECYFKERNFNQYIIILNEKNRGIVANNYSALSRATGKYVKCISPGDQLYRKNTLRKWVDFLEKNNYKWCFSRAVYYQRNRKSQVEVVTALTHPQNIKVYKQKNQNNMRWQYVVLSDIAVGVVMLCETQTQLQYIKEITNKIKYADDNIWRLMMFDGVQSGFYDEYTVLYEFGLGISTQNKAIWKRRLKMDWEKTNRIIYQRKKLDDFQCKMIKALKTENGNNELKKFFIKGFIEHKIKRKLFPQKTINYLP
ncbi:MAG: glycosyltransferase family 2 protein [bacterium]|nr:glycosyltransferase family 2 protein [bacterium]